MAPRANAGAQKAQSSVEDVAKEAKAKKRGGEMEKKRGSKKKADDAQLKKGSEEEKGGTPVGAVSVSAKGGKKRGRGRKSKVAVTPAAAQSVSPKERKRKGRKEKILAASTETGEKKRKRGKTEGAVQSPSASAAAAAAAEKKKKSAAAAKKKEVLDASASSDADVGKRKKRKVEETVQATSADAVGLKKRGREKKKASQTLGDVSQKKRLRGRTEKAALAPPDAAPQKKVGSGKDEEGSNKRRKTSKDTVSLPSRRAGLRNSVEDEKQVVKDEKNVVEAAGAAKKRKGKKKKTEPISSTTGSEPESTKAATIGPGAKATSTDGLRRSTRSSKPESESVAAAENEVEQIAVETVEEASGGDDDAESSEEQADGAPMHQKKSEKQEDEPVEGDVAVGNEAGQKEKEVEAHGEQKASVEETEQEQKRSKVLINRVPVITLWVPVVAQREGYTFEEGLSFGKMISGLYTHIKWNAPGVNDTGKEEKPENKKRSKQETEEVQVFGTKLHAKRMKDGKLLAVDQSGKAITPPSVLAYLKKAFGSNFEAAKGAMEALANGYSKEEIGGAAYQLYEKFRPTVAEGGRGFGARGMLDLNYISHLAQEKHLV